MPLPSLTHHRPVYREVLAQALRAAWLGWRYWPLALFASLLLTAGSYDVLLRSMDSIVNQSQSFAAASGQVSMWSALNDAYASGMDALSVVTGLQVLAAVGIVLLAIIVLACIAQAALVYTLGAVKRGQRPSLSQAIRVGGGAFWPVAALNALVLSTLWILRFLIAFPLYLAVEQQNSLTWALYLASFLLFVWLSFMVSVVHIFALNGLVLQGTPIAEALIRGYEMFKKNWVVVVETASLLFIIALAIGAGSVIISFIALIPLFAAMITAAAMHATGLFYAVVGFGVAFLILGILALASFVTQLQYATWTYLYRRLGEGGVVPKLHRWFRTVFDVKTVPQR